MYTYKATVIDVYDADTITIKIDLGFKITQEMRIRLDGIDAPELRGQTRELGLLARDYLTKLILNKEITITTVKDTQGKYGRYLGTIFLGDLNINKHLLNKGTVNRYTK
ncbi:MAG: thermonuclease family protein [Vibrio anguillarum]